MTRWKVGDQVAPLTDTELTVTDFVRYQGASGDMNPVHHDQGVAESVGYDRPLAVGMLSAGRLAAYLTDIFGPRSIRHFSVRFRSPAWPGDTLTYSAHVVEVNELSGGKEVTLAASATTQSGAVHVEGFARFVVI